MQSVILGQPKPRFLKWVCISDGRRDRDYAVGLILWFMRKKFADRTYFLARLGGHNWACSRTGERIPFVRYVIAIRAFDEKRAQSTPAFTGPQNQGMEIWKTKRVSHISTVIPARSSEDASRSGCTMNIGSKKLQREIVSTFCGAQVSESGVKFSGDVAAMEKSSPVLLPPLTVSR